MEKIPNPNFFLLNFCNFLSYFWFFYVIFKILLYSKLIFGLIGFNLAALCNIVIWKHSSLTVRYLGVFCMGYFALLGVLKHFFILKLSQESKQYFKKIANDIFSGELRKGVKALVWKQCWWKMGRFHLKIHTKLAFDTCLKAPSPKL